MLGAAVAIFTELSLGLALAFSPPKKEAIACFLGTGLAADCPDALRFGCVASGWSGFAPPGGDTIGHAAASAALLTTTTGLAAAVIFGFFAVKGEKKLPRFLAAGFEISLPWAALPLSVLTVALRFFVAAEVSQLLVVLAATVLPIFSFAELTAVFAVVLPLPLAAGLAAKPARHVVGVDAGVVERFIFARDACKVQNAWNWGVK